MEKNILLYYGENEYELETNIRKLSEKIGYAINEIQDSIDFADLINILNTPLLFSGNSLYVIRNESIINDSDNLEHLEEYLSNPSPFSMAVIALNKKPDERKKTFKFFKKKNLVVEFGLKKGRELQKWVKEYLWHHGYNINEDGLAYLIEVAGENQNMLKSEMDKLFLYEPQGKEIKLADLDKIITSNAQSNIFILLDNMFSDRSKMLASLENLFKLKEPVNLIIYMIIRDLRMIVRAKWYLGQRFSEDKIIKLIGGFPFIARRKIALARKLSFEEVFKYMKLFYELEERIKSGMGDEKVLLRSTLLSLK